jgi:hypothetical protein
MPSKKSKKSSAKLTQSHAAPVVTMPVDESPLPTSTPPQPVFSTSPVPGLGGLASTVAFTGAGSTTPSTVSSASSATSAPSTSAPAASSASSATTPTAFGGAYLADDPPNVTLPLIPASFNQPAMSVFRGSYPNKFELLAMPAAVNDLGRFVDYTSLLGSSATPAATFAAVVTRGLAWRAIRQEAEDWVTYVKAEDAMAWKAVSPILDEVRPLFLFAVSKNASIASTYPGLAQLFNASKEVAKAAKTTRAKNAKATAAKDAAATQAASDAANATAIAAATAAGVAAGKAAAGETAVTPPKAVTVNA